MLLPLCFLPGNFFSGWQFCALLVGLCLLSRIGSKQLCVLYGVYYSLLTLLSGFGGVFAFHYRRVYYTNAQAYLRSLNFKQMYQALLRCNITALIIVIAVYGVLAAALLAVAIPFFLPHMHDRYFFAADALTLALAAAWPQLAAPAVLCEFASLLGYHAYLRMRYLLPMADGALALIAALVILTVVLALELRQRSPLNGKIKKST